MSLDSVGSAAGLKAWTLDDEIGALENVVLEKLLDRSRRILEIYGPYSAGITNYSVLISELVYYTSEALWYWSQSVSTLISPAQSERIGSYSYQKSKQSDIKQIIEGHEIIWALILALRDLSRPFKYGTRVFSVMEANPDTGIRDIVDSYTDRTARAIKRLGLVSDTEAFNVVVYGDPHGWSD